MHPDFLLSNTKYNYKYKLSGDLMKHLRINTLLIWIWKIALKDSSCLIIVSIYQVVETMKSSSGLSIGNGSRKSQTPEGAMGPCDIQNLAVDGLRQHREPWDHKGCGSRRFKTPEGAMGSYRTW